MEEHSWQLHLDQLPRHYTCQIWYAVNWYKLTECRIWESVQKFPVELKPWWTDCLDPCCIKIGCRWLHIVFMMSLEAQKKKQHSTIKTICENLQVKRLSSACPKSCFESCSNMFSILELYNSVEEFVAKVQVALSPWKGSIERGNVDLPNRLAWNTDCMDCRDCMDCLCSNQLLTTSIINAFINDYHLKSFVPWIALDKSQVLTKTVCMLDVASKHQRRYMKNACQVGTHKRRQERQESRSPRSPRSRSRLEAPVIVVEEHCPVTRASRSTSGIFDLEIQVVICIWYVYDMYIFWHWLNVICILYTWYVMARGYQRFSFAGLQWIQFEKQMQAKKFEIKTQCVHIKPPVPLEHGHCLGSVDKPNTPWVLWNFCGLLRPNWSRLDRVWSSDSPVTVSCYL